MERRQLFRTAGTLAAVAAAGTFASPSWAQDSSETSPEVLPQLTVDDWKAIQAAAEAAGDAEAVEAAAYGASVAANQSTQAARAAVAAPMVVPTLIKKAIKAALKYGGHKVPKPLRPYTNKILDVLENTEAWEEAALTAGFMQMGIPPDVSHQAARWIVTFVG